jgi:uroporphyrinogen decarboxylase
MPAGMSSRPPNAMLSGMMSKRDVIRSLLAKEIPNRIGLHEHFWPHILENAWTGQGVPADVDWVQRYDLDMRSLFWCCAPGPRKDLEGVLDENDEWKTSRDAWGSTFRYFKQKSGTPEHIGFTCTSAEVWQRDFREQLRAIDPRSLMDLPRMREQYASAMAGQEFVTFSGLSVFEELRRILGDVCMLESLASEPEFVEDFCTSITDWHISWWDVVLREVGRPDGVHIYEDLGYTKGPFCSPKMHRRLILPHHKRFFGFIKEHKLPLIVHTCGDFRPHLPALHEAGADCIQALEAKTGMDVVALARDWKDKLCFMGNLDIRAFESGDRAKIRDEVTYKLDGMKAARAPWIFMSDHSIPPTVRESDYAYALQLYRDGCRYG